MIRLPNKRGLRAHLESLGWTMRQRGGTWFARNAAGLEDDAACQATINAYDELPAVKADKVTAIKADGLTRIQFVFPAVRDLEELRLLSNIIQSIAPAARQLTAPMQKASAIWIAAQDAIALVNAAMTAGQAEAVTPAWPVP